MADIGSRTFNLIEDRYLTLANEEYLRPLSLGNNWSKLRLGAMVALTPDGANSLPGCTLLLGICSAADPFANTAGYGAASTTNFIGLDFITNGAGTSGPGTFSYYAGSGGNPYFGGTYAGARRRVGTTNTFAATGVMNGYVTTNTGTLPRRSLLYCDLTKGSPNYTLKAYLHNATQAGLDFTPAQFLDGLEQSGTPIVNGQTLLTATAATLACAEDAGPLNTLSLFWNRAAFPLEVYALAAFRMA